MRDESLAGYVARHVAEATGPTAWGFAILGALQAKHVYEGTVSPAVKAKRRSLGRRQKASRRANRG